MYKREQLSTEIYFNNLLKTKDITSILDSLTGVILRPYIIGYVNHLIQNHIPCTVAIMDLDNFKAINDNYGHKIGDEVLCGVCNDMISYLGENGFVGRIGGDEFMLINLKDLEYDDKKLFYKNMYANYTVLRKNISLESCDPFITATIGSATYPTDADNYDDLFTLMDKTLYRGKTKGRNCYIIYVEAKHKNLEIRKLTHHGIYQTFYNLSENFDKGTTVQEKLEKMFPVLEEDIRIKNLFYITEDNKVSDLLHTVNGDTVDDIDHLLTNDMFKSNSVEEIMDKSPVFYDFLTRHKLETFMIVKLRMADKKMGYLMCAEPQSHRIWQDDEGAILYFAGKLLAGYILRS